MDERWPFFTVDIELTSHCGQNCLFCPRERLTRPAGFLEPALFADIARQLAAFGSRITFCGMGNPLLHPDIESISKICNDLQLHYGLTVQAPALNPDGLQKITLLRPAFIEISFPTLDSQLFSQLYPGQNLADSLTGLHNLANARGSNRGLTVNAIVTTSEPMSEVDIKAFWSEKGLNCRLQQCHSRGGNLLDKNLVNSTPRKIEKCGLFASHSFISWEGHLLSCCHDLKGETSIARLSETPLAEAAAKKLQILAAGMPFKICANCDEPAANRPVPDRPFPESPKARSRYLKNLCSQL